MKINFDSFHAREGQTLITGDKENTKVDENARPARQEARKSVAPLEVKSTGESGANDAFYSEGRINPRYLAGYQSIADLRSRLEVCRTRIYHLWSGYTILA